MNKYFFEYSVKLPSGDYQELSFDCEASRLSSALKLFSRSSKEFSFPVYVLKPRYRVINSIGKMSYRLLPAKYLLFKDWSDA